MVFKCLIASIVLFGALLPNLSDAAPDYAGTEGPPIKFRTVLSADEQSAPTESPGIGHAEFILDRPSQRLDWTITYSKLTSGAVAAHIHGPQTPGGNAGVLFDLAPDGMASPVLGSVILNDGELEYLLTGRLYVNIHSTRYPAGELRGQIMRVRPE
ncbi:MAG: CHRD domain-containing protein [Alphaproteobacteria bacterium]|nr:CHRD domain-containing protein [Alphaproteobacteria bacterium]